ncbi:MAG: hypothetical protein J0H52_20505 [Comamonadaceae bacterium]|nr:hypothetical protein [Comamonadaceae bacterium]
MDTAENTNRASFPKRPIQFRKAFDIQTTHSMLIYRKSTNQWVGRISSAINLRCRYEKYPFGGDACAVLAGWRGGAEATDSLAAFLVKKGANFRGRA